MQLHMNIHLLLNNGMIAILLNLIVVVKDHMVLWNDEFGILYIGIEEFLLNEHSLDL